MPSDAPVIDLKILRGDAVETVTGLSVAQIAKLERRGEFPARVALGLRSVGWIDTEVQAWIRARMALRTQEAVTEALKMARMPPGERARYRRAHEREDDAPA